MPNPLKSIGYLTVPERPIQPEQLFELIPRYRKKTGHSVSIKKSAISGALLFLIEKSLRIVYLNWAMRDCHHVNNSSDISAHIDGFPMTFSGINSLLISSIEIVIGISYPFK